MSKAQWIIAGVGTVAVVTVTLLVTRAKSTLVEPVGEPGGVETPSVPTATATGERTYDDASGISFNYPANFSVSDETPDDQSTYTLLYLTKVSARMKILARETTATSVDGWLTSDRDAPKNPTELSSVTLAGIGAKQFSASGKLMTVAVDRNVAYLVESIRDGGEWEAVHNLVVSSFKFQTAPPAQSGGSTGTAVGSSGAASGSPVIEEAEEVVE